MYVPVRRQSRKDLFGFYCLEQLCALCAITLKVADLNFSKFKKKNHRNEETPWDLYSSLFSPQFSTFFRTAFASLLKIWWQAIHTIMRLKNGAKRDSRSQLTSDCITIANSRGGVLWCGCCFYAQLRFIARKLLLHTASFTRRASSVDLHESYLSKYNHWYVSIGLFLIIIPCVYGALFTCYLLRIRYWFLHPSSLPLDADNKKVSILLVAASIGFLFWIDTTSFKMIYDYVSSRSF